MTPGEAIGMLDRQLQAHGEPVTILAVNAGVAVEPGVTAQGFVRSYKPEQLVGNIQQKDRKVILSPTDITTLPVAGSKARIAGKLHNVEFVYPLRIGPSVVRIELQVRG